MGSEHRELRELIQEVRELGWRATAFRVGWELRKRVIAPRLTPPAPDRLDPAISQGSWIARLPFADPPAVAAAMADRVPADHLRRLARVAEDATRGRIVAFGRWIADYGDPIDWHLNPVNRERWDPRTPAAIAMADEARVGDVKLTWEVARFPHAYQIARAAAFQPGTGPGLASALLAQMAQFSAANPYDRGVHWASGQEVAIRLLSWLFALDVLLLRGADGARATDLVADALVAGAEHIENNIAYARFAVYNNHLLSEALALYAVGVLLPELPSASQWRDTGKQLLTEGARRQFYDDGGYIQLSHNYHRSALQMLLLAGGFARMAGDRPDAAWLAAMERSLDFLVAHQNPVDGRLPNYGANDGALPAVLSTCDFSDFRPTLQAISVAVRGERIYEPGPWDEDTAWLSGPAALDLPLRRPARTSVSFETTGFHVLRGGDDASFAAFRCGSILDRFAQIDMLHLDVWWRGHNVLVDAGSYLYNGPAEWHEHFLKTASHNTVSVDGHDQMLHFRRFKNLYWTKARLLGLTEAPSHTICTGEHDGFARHPGGCVHRRSVLVLEGDLWIVADRVSGTGSHEMVLHWLAADFPYHHAGGRLRLDTPAGPFSIAVYDDVGTPMTSTVIAGATAPPRGWMSRYYAERSGSPSLTVERTGEVPHGLLSVLGAGEPTLTRDGDTFIVHHDGKHHRFRVDDGVISV